MKNKFHSKSFWLKLLICLFLSITRTAPQSIATENVVESGLSFIDYFYPPNTTKNNKFYTGILGGTRKLISIENDYSYSYSPIFTKISNVVYHPLTNTFFLCPRDNGIIWELPANLSQANGMTNYDTDFDSSVTIKGLRCSADDKESIFFIAYLGYHAVYTFQFKINAFLQYITFEIDEKIIAFHTPDDRKATQKFYILTKNDVKKRYYLRIRYYPTDSLAEKDHEFYYEALPLLYNVEMSLNTIMPQVIIFSYSATAFNYFFIDTATGAMVKSNTTGTLFGMTGITITEASFVPNSELLMYRGVFESKNILGVGDVFQDISLFKQERSVLSVVYYPVSDTQKLIAISENNELKTLDCPFVKTEGEAKCTIDCSGSGVGYLSNSAENVCKQCNTIPKKFYVRYCLDSCPYGLFPDPDNFCVKCSGSTPYYNGEVSTCVSTCPLYYGYDVYNVCYKCITKGEYYDAAKHACVIACPTNWISDITTGICKKCKDEDKFFCGKPHECCDKCPDYQVWNVDNVCYDCKSEIKFYVYSQKVCVDSCPDNAIIDTTNYRCDICKDKTPASYYLPSTNTCEPACPTYHLSDANNRCYTCKEDNKFFNYGTCVIQCPAGSSINTSENICTYCKLDGKYLSQKACVSACPVNQMWDADNTCYTCKERFGIYYDTNLKQCVTDCSPGSQKDEANKICTPCKPLNKFLNGNECVNSCPARNIVIDNNICYSCKDNNKFYVDPDSTCETTCPDYMHIDNDNFYCQNCKAVFKVNMNNMCQETCNEYYITDSNNKCYNCKLDRGGMFLEDDTCVESCPDGAKVDTVNNVCSYCLEGEFYLKDKDQCVNACPPSYLVNDSKRCYKCKEILKYFYSNICYQTCPSHCSVDKTNYTCDCCVDRGEFLSNNKCITGSCPLDSITLDKNVCQSCKADGKYKLGNQCAPSCPDHAAIDKENWVCDVCVDRGKYLYPAERDKCKDNCGLYSRVLDNNICAPCKDNPVDVYYLDKGDPKVSECVSSCPDHSSPDVVNKSCVSCIDYGQWLFEKDKKCIPTCPYCKQENNICKFCNECQVVGKIKYQNTCVDSCPAGSVLNSTNECIKCVDGSDGNPSLTPYFHEGKCVEKCPNRYYHDDNKICIHCKDFIYMNMCLANCPYLFGIISEETRNCEDCKSLNMFNYENQCVEACPSDTTADHQNSVCNKNIIVTCLNNCSNRGKCDQASKQCICHSGYVGDYCEIAIKTDGSYYSIVPLNRILKSTVNAFQLRFSDEKASSNNITLYWNVDTIKEDSKYLTGRNQKTLKLPEYALSEGKNMITLFMKDETLRAFYRAIVELNIKSLDASRFSCNVKYFLDNKPMSYGVSMKTLVVVEVLDKKIKPVSSKRNLQEESERLSYKFYYEDSYGQQLEITGVFLSSNTFARTIPLTKKLIVVVQDNLGQIVQFSYPLDIRKDETLSISVDNLINSPSVTPNQKLIEIYNFLNHKDEKMNTDNVNKIKDFLQDSFDTIIENKDSTISHSSILAVVNQLVINQSQDKTNPDSLKVVTDLNKLLNNFAEKINSQTDPKSVSKNDLKSYYRSLDFVFEAFNSFDYGKNPGTDKIGSEQLKQVQNSIQNINQYLSRGMDSNERIIISTKNFDSYIERPSKDQKLIELEEVNKEKNSFKKYDDYSLQNKEKKTECGDNTYLCVSKENMKVFEKNLKFVEGIDLDNIAFFALNINNQNKYNGTSSTYRPLSTTSFATGIYDTKGNSTLVNTNYFSFDVVLRIPPDTDKNTAKDSACMSISKANKPLPSCKTYYNYTSSKTICKCTGTGEVVNIYNYTLANLGKIFQFPDWSLELVNPLSMCLVLGSLSITILFSIILLCYDYYDDRNFLSSNDFNDHQVVHNEFKDLNSLCKANIFSFALYVTMYIYPFFSVFSIYNYNQPRFLRFSVEMMSILMSMCFSLLPYYKVPFDYQQIYKDKRDVEESEWSVDSLPYKISDILATLVYSVFATIIITIILTIFSNMMKWREMMLKIWKYRKDIINRYVRQYLIKSLALPEKWKMLRNRILALNAICGKWILKKHLEREEFRKKKENGFVKLFEGGNSETNLKQRLIKDNSSKSKEISLELRTSNSFFRMNSMKSNVRERDSYNPKQKDDMLYMTKAENLSLNIDKYDRKAKKKLEKMEEIRSLYFKKRKVSENFDQILVNKYDPTKLKMYRLTQFKFFNIKPNEILLKKFREEKFNMIKSILAVFLLFGFFFFLYFLLIMMISDIYHRYRYYILKVWLFPSLIQLFLVRFLINYGLNFLKSYLLFRHYAMRKTKCLIKILYALFMRKDVVYMYRIRNFITRYEKELKEVKKRKDVDPKEAKDDSLNAELNA